MAATITVRYWAGAQRAAGVEQETMRVETISELRATLSMRAGFARLALAVSFLVDGLHAGEQERPADGAVVDVLPPFAGG